jgi:DNA-binding NarL/FixJ family response regulator
MSSHGRDPKRAASREGRIVVVSNRALERERLVDGLLRYNSELSVKAVESVDEFRRLPKRVDVRAILLNFGDTRVTEQEVRQQLKNLVCEVGVVPVIVIAEADEPADMLAALDSGARGYVPTSANIGVVAEATNLACAGGTFVPASGVLALREVIRAKPGNTPPQSIFTPRESGVVEALRKGKANKIIAYELNMSEGTVKVHIRNIMKKLKATNRTEVAYRLSEIAA